MKTDWLSSKTVLGFFSLLLTIIGLSLAGKLTIETVEAIKWLGVSFFSVRTAANVFENISTKGQNNGNNGS